MLGIGPLAEPLGPFYVIWCAVCVYLIEQGWRKRSHHHQVVICGLVWERLSSQSPRGYLGQLLAVSLLLLLIVIPVVNILSSVGYFHRDN